MAIGWPRCENTTQPLDCTAHNVDSKTLYAKQRTTKYKMEQRIRHVQKIMTKRQIRERRRLPNLAVGSHKSDDIAVEEVKKGNCGKGGQKKASHPLIWCR